jgi:hypothetical protein
MVFVEVDPCLKMAEGYPVFLSLQSWVVRDSFFDPIFMVALEANPEGTLTLVILEGVTQTLLSIVVGIDVTLEIGRASCRERVLLAV